MIVQGREETAAVDAALDAEFEAAAEAAATLGEDAEPADQNSMRPWWLDDPNLKHRYGAGS